LCALAGALFLTPYILTGCMDAAAAGPVCAHNAHPADKPPITAVALASRGDDPDEDAKITAALVEQGYFREDVPLSYDLQDALHTACTQYGIDYAVALGLIEVESAFDTEAVNPSSGCYGLTQLNPRYHPSGLSPADNIEYGMRYLSGQINRYGSLEAGLQAYHDGHDTGARWYANAVLEAAERWKERQRARDPYYCAEIATGTVYIAL